MGGKGGGGLDPTMNYVIISGLSSTNVGSTNCFNLLIVEP